MRFRCSIDLVIDNFSNTVDAEGDDCDAESRRGVAPLVDKHRVRSPCVSPPEELSGGSQCLRHFSSSSRLSGDLQKIELGKL